MNFAAETHVDRSISGPEAFLRTQMDGTYVLLEAARERGLRYVQVSTDEVYGSIEEGSFTEASPLNPSSPYSATKTGADLLVASYVHTYALRRVDLPRLQRLRAAPVPREADPADDPQRAARRPAAGLRRRPAGPQLAVRRGLRARHRPRPRTRRAGRRSTTSAAPTKRPTSTSWGASSRSPAPTPASIEHVTDRPGHDRRYSLSSDRIRALGWQAQVRFDQGLEQTVAWYRDNTWWWEPIRSGEYRAYYERQYGRALG